MKNYSLIFLVATILYSCNQPKEKAATSDSPLFELLPTSVTGIDFVKQVTDKEGFNILSYRNFYNGGGVAISDINNDSLPDLYFNPNLNKNKLFQIVVAGGIA